MRLKDDLVHQGWMRRTVFSTIETVAVSRALPLPSFAQHRRSGDSVGLFRTARAFHTGWFDHTIPMLYGEAVRSSICFAFATFLMTALPSVVTAESIQPILEFKGAVEPSRTVIVANHITGIVADLRFAGGQDVIAGDVLALIDPLEFEIALRASGATLKETRALLRLAQDDLEREAQLLAKGSGSRVALLQAEVAHDIAVAQLDQRQAAYDLAALTLARTEVTAPISGTISPPRLAQGTLVEAKAGTALAEIVVLDPIRVAYQVPYSDRTQALVMANASDLAELHSRTSLMLTLPSGARYPHEGYPVFESGAIDPATNTLTVWGLFPNPKRQLVPGLAVTIHASFHSAVQE